MGSGGEVVRGSEGLKKGPGISEQTLTGPLLFHGDKTFCTMSFQVHL